MGVGVLSFAVGVPPEDLRKRVAAYRDGLAECTRPKGHVRNEQVATFTMVHCADTDEKAFEEAAESFEWYVRTALWHIGTVAEWREGKPLRDYDYAQVIHDVDLSGLSFDYLQSSGACIVGSPDEVRDRIEALDEAGQRGRIPEDTLGSMSRTRLRGNEARHRPLLIDNANTTISDNRKI